MTFTDDDLKRLKERADFHRFDTNGLMSREIFDALLARLEAAEKVIKKYHTWEDWDDSAYKAWRKAAGRE